MRPSPRTGWLLVLLSAILQILSFPSPSLYFCSWIALTPLFVALLDRRFSPSLIRCVLLAYFNGVIWYAGTCFWIFHVMHSYGTLSQPVAAGILVLFCLYLALYHAAFGLLLGLLTRSRAFANARALLLAPVLWVAVELARAHLTSFPWDLLGYAQVNNLPLTRIATFTGVYGLSFVIALVNTVLALGFLLPRERRTTVALVGVLGAIALESGAAVPYLPVHPDHFAELVQVRNILSLAHSLADGIGELSRGNQRNLLSVDEHGVGTFICYESIFPDEVLRFAKNGAELFVNISDDGWYGEYGAPGQHLNMARMRAIENGRWLLRATNNGITASISPLGELLAVAPRDTSTVLQAPYRFESGTTFYTRHGDWFAHTCAIISVLALLVAVLSGQRLRNR